MSASRLCMVFSVTSLTTIDLTIIVKSMGVTKQEHWCKHR